MQSILNIKLKMETQAKQEFSVAKTALDEEEEQLSTVRSCVTESEDTKGAGQSFCPAH